MEEILHITKANAKEAFAKGTDAEKALISRLFPNDFGDLFTRITTFKDVVRESGNPEGWYEVTSGMSDEQKHEVYARKMRLIYSVFNGDWKPDYTNKRQPKHYPWFEFVAGQGFVLHRVDYHYDCTNVSPRLCARDEKTVRHICKHFLKEYNDYLLS